MITRVLTVLVVLVLIGGALLYRSLERSATPEPEPEAAPAVVEETEREPEPKSPPELPAYEILEVTELMAGGRFADVLVESLSRDTPAAERERVARLIKQKEGLKGIALYCSQEAMVAEYSASYAEENPGARECVLGSIDESGDAHFE